MNSEIQSLTFTDNAAGALGKLLQTLDYDRLFVLTDDTTHRLCLDKLQGCPELANMQSISILPTDEHKDVAGLSEVWRGLSDGGATRHSVMVNVGGGMVTDLGGFAASTFKRGIRFINIPTTLLAMVDASVGGKTGINFNGLKNEVGVFNNALDVIIDTGFLRTLDTRNLLSGYAEMIKHGLISNTDDWAELLRFDFNDPDTAAIGRLVQKSVEVKKRIVIEDPREKGLRKALNLGHTAGHAFESFALHNGRPVLHGYAVAWGLVCELFLSVIKQNFPKEKMRQTISFIRENYGTMLIDCKCYDTLYTLMTHDKKNTSGRINFTLLSDVGKIQLDCTATKDEIFEMLDFYREQF